MDKNEPPEFEPLWGAEKISDALFPDAPPEQRRANTRKTYHLLETGAIPARKVGALWVSERNRLRAFFTGNEVQPEM